MPFGLILLNNISRHGIPINTDMGVIIQKMIVSDCGGILSTCHPFSENPTVVFVNGNYGLPQVLYKIHVIWLASDQIFCSGRYYGNNS